MEGGVIERQGVRYWTTQEVANSLAARRVIEHDGTRREQLRRARRWARGVDLRPSATTRTGGLLWGVDETCAAMDLTSSLVPPSV